MVRVVVPEVLGSPHPGELMVERTAATRFPGGVAEVGTARSGNPTAKNRVDPPAIAMARTAPRRQRHFARVQPKRRCATVGVK
jgi:hypothetical protein